MYNMNSVITKVITSGDTININKTIEGILSAYFAKDLNGDEEKVREAKASLKYGTAIISGTHILIWWDFDPTICSYPKVSKWFMESVSRNNNFKRYGFKPIFLENDYQKINSPEIIRLIAESKNIVYPHSHILSITRGVMGKILKSHNMGTYFEDQSGETVLSHAVSVLYKTR